MPQKRPHMDPRLAARIGQKKTRLDHYRPFPNDTVQRLNADLKVFITYHSNAIEGNSLSLRETQMVIDYGITIHTSKWTHQQEPERWTGLVHEASHGSALGTRDLAFLSGWSMNGDFRQTGREPGGK